MLDDAALVLRAALERRFADFDLPRLGLHLQKGRTERRRKCEDGAGVVHIFVNQLVVYAHAVTLARLLRHKWRLREGVVDVIEISDDSVIGAPPWISVGTTPFGLSSKYAGSYWSPRSVMMWSLASCPFSFSAMRTFWAQTELMLWYNSSTSSSSLRRKPRAIVRLSQIDGCSFWNDSGRVEFGDRVVIDHVVTWLYRRGYSRHLVELPHIIRQIGIVGDSLLVAFEQRKIGHIEAD